MRAQAGPGSPRPASEGRLPQTVRVHADPNPRVAGPQSFALTLEGGTTEPPRRHGYFIED